MIQSDFGKLRAAYVRTLAPVLETFHSRGEELVRRVEFYTELRYFMTKAADKPEFFSIRERDIRRANCGGSPITFCSAALAAESEGLVVRHHHRYPSFGSSRR